MPHPSRSSSNDRFIVPEEEQPDLQRGPLPMVRTAFFGREMEAKTILRHLHDDVAIVSLTGPGGVGKTRLALQVARDAASNYPDGTIFVDLSALHHPNEVLPSIAQAAGIVGTARKDLTDILPAVLRPKQVLLVLDNCEHVISAMPRVASLLMACPTLQILATSRAPLRLYGEHSVRLHPLPLPASPDLPAQDLLKNDAIRLFLDRARMVEPTLESDEEQLRAIAWICRHLDGLPLAIELAAARSSLFQPGALLNSLSDRLDLLVGGPRDRPSRQRTLRSTIAWSYDLLSREEQALFRRLAVFEAGFDPEAASAVASVSSGDVLRRLDTLVDQSLMNRVNHPDTRQRFVLLETTREFAREQLQHLGEAENARRRHAIYFLHFAERMEADIYGPEMHQRLDQMATDYPNCRSALGYFVDTGDATRELRLAAMLSEYWSYRGRFSEGFTALSEALNRGSEAPPGPQSKAMGELAFLAWLSGDLTHALSLSAAAIPLALQAGDAYRLSQILFIRASVLASQGEPHEETISLLQEAIELVRYVEPPSPHYISLLAELGWAWLRAGNREQCLELIDQAIELLQANGNNFELGWTFVRLGRLAHLDGDLRRAARHYAESLRAFRESGAFTQVGYPLTDVCELLLSNGHRPVAERLARTIQSITEQTGARFDHEPIGPPAPFGRSGGEPSRPTIEQLARSVPPVPFSEALDEAIAAAEALAAGRTPHSDSDPARFDVPVQLSTREQEVLSLLSQRYTAPEIADELFISVRTVERHVSNIYTKLNVNSRRAAVAVAIRYGLVYPH